MKIAKITIGHNIGKTFNYNDFTHIITLLGGRNENADRIGIKVKSRNINWLWLPMQNAKIKSISPKLFYSYLLKVKELMENPENNIYLHCSAGIHRTGMITYGTLRLLGNSAKKSLEILYELRPITRNEVKEKRLSFVEKVLEMYI